MAAAGSSWTGPGACGFLVDGSMSAVHRERRSGGDTGQGVAYPQDGRDTVFASHDGGVRPLPASISARTMDS